MRDKTIRSLHKFIESDEVVEFEDKSWIEDFGLESLTLFHFLLQLEKDHDFTFDEDDFTMGNMENFKDLVEMVKRRRAES